MTLALAATAEVHSGIPRVKLDVTGAAGSTITIYRTDPDGSIVAVREADPIEGFVAPSGTVYDYEAPSDAAVTYKVIDGATTATSGSVTSSSGGVPFLIHPGLPLLSVPLTTVLEWPTWTRPIVTGLFQPIGRRLRVGVSTRRQSVEGTLVVATGDATSRAAMEAILADGTTLLLKGSSKEHAATRWVAIGDVTEQPHELDLRTWNVWTLPLVEVDRPAGTALPPVTYADVVSTFATYAAMEAAVPTYADLVGGAWS